MKLIKKTLIATAVASALLASTSAMALWSSAPNTTKSVIIQSTTNVSGIDADDASPGLLGVSFALTTAPAQALTVNDQVIYTLTGGAKFTGVPVLTATPPSGPLAASSFDGFFEADGVTPTTTPGSGASIKFHMTDGLAVAGTVLTLNSDTPIFNLAGVSVAGNVDIKITTKNVVGNVNNNISNISLKDTSLLVLPGAKYLFQGLNLLSCTGASVVSSANTADVSLQFKKFLGNLVDGTPLTYTVTSQSTFPATPISAGKILYKLAGDFTGIASITGTGITGTDSTGTTVGTAGLFTINAAKTEAYAFNTAALAGGSSLAILPQFHIDGTTAQGARSFDLTTSVLADTANFWAAHNVTCDSASYTINRNGSTFVINSFGSANTLKITDVSRKDLTGSGKITFTAYDGTGAVVGTAGSQVINPNNGQPYTLKTSSTAVIPGKVITDTFPTAVHYEVAVESEAIEASSVKLVNGALTSISVFTNKAAAGGI